MEIEKKNYFYQLVGLVVVVIGVIFGVNGYCWTGTGLCLLGALFIISNSE